MALHVLRASGEVEVTALLSTVNAAAGRWPCMPSGAPCSKPKPTVLAYRLSSSTSPPPAPTRSGVGEDPNQT